MTTENRNFAESAINTALVNTDKTIQKYIKLLAGNEITERQIIDLRSLIHSNQLAAKVLLPLCEEIEMNLTNEQNQKGIDFLMKYSKKRNSTLAAREKAILDNFSHSTFAGLYKVGNKYNSFYLPLYNCYDKNGNCFQYWYNMSTQTVEITN